MTALTGCGGGDGVGAADKQATTARAAEKAAEDEVTVDVVRGDIRSAIKAAGIGRLEFFDMSKLATPCVVAGAWRTEDAPKREAVDSVFAVLKARGWGQRERMRAEDGGQAWRVVKNGWGMFVGAGKFPAGAGIGFDATGKACGVPIPPRPSDIAPPERPVLP
ncbi:hypothetical protein QBA35_07240 [Streptomyces bottropensis]|uniref:Lipoprotein n=1 Tax=Streptomyces bottropensis TaxID=42235 RepID=A0ABU8AIZ9_9ACTN